mmetsp:Transcript_23887/g.66178  ORF Transcript_23887/g.66178 Transcript_23887/m.66178 type:complete len:227 (+) Transcript_23887:1662-2342(+)
MSEDGYIYIYIYIHPHSSITPNGFATPLSGRLSPLVQVLLVVIVRAVKDRRRSKVDVAVPAVPDGGNVVLRVFPLGFVVVKNPVAVLGFPREQDGAVAFVVVVVIVIVVVVVIVIPVVFRKDVELKVFRRSNGQSLVVNLENVRVGNNPVVIDHQHGLAMPRVALPDPGIGRWVQRALCVAGACGHHPGGSHKGQLDAPEAAHGKGANLVRGRQWFDGIVCICICI